MRNHNLRNQIERLQILIRRSREASGDDFWLLSHWAKYLCVLSSGFLENSIREIYGEFVDNAPQPIANYARRQLSNIRNPNEQKFFEIAQSFNPAWAEELREFTENGGRKDAIDSIISNRHRVAHGRDTTITVARLQDYLDRAIEVIDFIEEQCNS